jgi:hypothetical protein
VALWGVTTVSEKFTASIFMVKKKEVICPSKKLVTTYNRCFQTGFREGASRVPQNTDQNFGVLYVFENIFNIIIKSQ